MSESRAPSLIASVVLHVAVLGAGLIAWPFFAKPLKIVASTPVTIVSHAPPEAPTALVEAPVPTPETTPEPAPVEQAAPPPPAPRPPTPAPKPTPAPPPPKPTPAPAPKPAPTAPTPKKAESKPVDLSALAASLPQSKPQPNKNAKPSSKPFDLAALANSLPKSAGAKGPAHQAAAPTVAPGPPRPLSGDEIGALTGKLMRLWNPNCEAEGAGRVVVRVEFRLTPDGHLAGAPMLRNQPVIDAGGAAAQIAAQRALTAVRRGEPYTELPRDRYDAWKDVTVNFQGKDACGG